MLERFFSWPIVVLSLVVGILVSYTTLGLAGRNATLTDTRYRLSWQLGSAFAFGMGLWGMHFVGMLSLSLPIAASDMTPVWAAATVAGMTVGVLAVALVLSVLDVRLDGQTTRFATELEQANHDLLHLAMHDTLTQLPNRRFLTEYLQRAIDAAAAHHRQVAIFFLDLDGFKPINDSLGHEVGDAVLVELAGRLRGTMRQRDLVARFGGDEFVVVVEGVQSIADAEDVASRLFSCFHADFARVGADIILRPSIGISLYPRDGNDPDVLIQQADAAMYDAKANGRNRYRFFESGMNAETLRTKVIQRALQAATERDELRLDYQLKFTSDGLPIPEAEVFLRWHSNDLGTVPPEQFVPIAEQSGQIIALGAWVLNEVCRQLARWDAAERPRLKIAINLSPIQLRGPTLADSALAIIRKHDITADRVMFEISESAAMRDAEATKRALTALKDAGFEVAIDDFGTGYSSLSYLQQFAVRQLKIDRYFVGALEHRDPNSVSIVSSIVGLAHTLGMRVVAEGVESSRQLDVLHALGCDEAQGYFLARPLAAEAFMALVVKALGASPIEQTTLTALPHHLPGTITVA